MSKNTKKEEKKPKHNFFVPVFSHDNKPLMPTTLFRARRWTESKRATPFWKHGIYCVRMNEIVGIKTQPIVVGIDPGGKQEGFTVKSRSHTYFNFQSDAVDWVKESEIASTQARRRRRCRNTPCRKPRFNRKGRNLPPSTKARWQWKLRITIFLKKLLPLTDCIVEDIKAESKGQPLWDQSFSLVQNGKNWFYYELEKLFYLTIKQGYETKKLRDQIGLKKYKNKLSANFHAHCVDSWVLSLLVMGGVKHPDNKSVICIVPLRFYRRQLHVFQPSKSGKRKNHGSTRSIGFKRGSLVKHKKFGTCYVGGTPNDKISLHSVVTKKRITTKAKVEHCKFVCFNSWLMF